MWHEMGLVAVISNPLSTRNRAIMPRIRRILENAHDAFHYELDDIAAVPDALRKISTVRPAVLVVNGGDGTLQAVMSSIINDAPFDGVPPPIFVLPSGKTNMVAEDLGAARGPERLLRRIIEMTDRGEITEATVHRHLIGLDFGDGHPTRYGMFFGGAAIVNAILYIRAKIYPLGLPNLLSHVLALLIVVFSTFGGGRSEDSPIFSRPMRIKLLGGGIITGRFFTVTVTTLDRLLLGFRPYSDDGLGALKFSSVDQGAGPVFRALFALVTRRFGKTTIAGIQTRRANKLKIEGDDPFTLDGELFKPLPGHAVVMRGDKSLSFVALG